MDEALFRQQLHEQAYGEAQAVEFEPNTAREMQAHDFSAFVLVTRGAFTLVTEDGSVTHQPGEACTLEAGTLHSEQTGADGATVLLGKK